MPANTKNYSYLMDPEYRKIFFNNYAKFPSMFDQVFSVETINKGNRVSEASLSPLGAARVIAEGGQVQFDTPEQGQAVTKYFTKYGLGFQVTEEMQDDDLTGLIKKMPAELAVSLGYARELAAWDMFNNGQTASLYTCKDALAIFSASHTLLKSPGTTQSNLASTSASLSETSLQAALDAIVAWKDEAGRYTIFEPEWLVVPTGLRWMAELLTKNQWRPQSSDRDINTTTSIYSGIKPLVVPYLTSTTAWFVMCKQRDFRFNWRKNVGFGSSDDFSTGNALFKSTARWVVWCYDWRGAYRNAGA